MRHLVLGLVMALLLAGSAISAGPSANAFITNSGVTDVSVLDTATNGLSAVSIGASTHGVAMDPKGTRGYVAGAAGANPVIATIFAVGSVFVGVAIAPDGTRLYAADYGNGRLLGITVAGIAADAVVDCAAPAAPLVACVNVGSGPFGVAVSPNGKRVVVANSGSHDVTMID